MGPIQRLRQKLRLIILAYFMAFATSIPKDRHIIVQIALYSDYTHNATMQACACDNAGILPTAAPMSAGIRSYFCRTTLALRDAN